MQGGSMNRYQSTQRWRKVEAGQYESPDGQWRAHHGNRQWILHAKVTGQVYDWLRLSSFLTLADCQEHAAKLEGGR